MSVRSQIAALNQIRDSSIPVDASTSFVEGWKAAFSAIFNDEKLFDLMPKAAIVVDVTPRMATRFIEQMRSSGYTPVKDEASDNGQEYWYFKRGNETSIDYEVIIERPGRKAFLRIRPR